MARSYPIWVDINCSDHKSSRSFGVRTDATLNVLVGSSSSNSHDFCNVKLEKVKSSKNTMTGFKLYIDDKLVKEMWFEDTAKQSAVNKISEVLYVKDFEK